MRVERIHGVVLRGCSSIIWLWLLILSVMPISSRAHEFTYQDILIIHPSLPATGVFDTSAPVNMILSNLSQDDDRLLSIETTLGPIRFVREIKASDGSVSYERLDAVNLPAGAVVPLLKGEIQGRLEGLQYPLAEGSNLQGRMLFEKRGAYDMFFMVDPMVSVVLETPLEDKAVNLRARSENTHIAEHILEISGRIREVLNIDPEDSELMIGPIVVDDDVAVAGWKVGADGARILLKRDSKIGWYVLMWSGKSLLLPATLTRFGIRGEQAKLLMSKMRALETALGKSFISAFDQFPGTAFPTKPCARLGESHACSLQTNK